MGNRKKYIYFITRILMAIAICGITALVLKIDKKNITKEYYGKIV